MQQNMRVTISALISLFIAIPAQASDIYAEYVRNYDGDTVTVDLVDLRDIDLDGTFAPLWDNIGIRVAGVDNALERIANQMEVANKLEEKKMLLNEKLAKLQMKEINENRSSK